MDGLAIFTDLDGTLLDHESYDAGPARPLLARLSRAGIPVVIASSKTAAEIAPLRRALGLAASPAIFENGAGVLGPGAEPPEDTTARDRLLAALASLPTDLRAGFRGFAEMSVAEVAACTGLPSDAAARARARTHTEPGLWTGPEPRRRTFIDALAARGVAAQEGGRFLTLSMGGTKAGRMAGLAARLGARVTVALGDAPNDVEMLETADHGIVVANPHHAPLPELAGERQGRITRTAKPGPDGWAEGLEALLSRLGYRI